MWNDERDRPRPPVVEPEILPPEHRGQQRRDEVFIRHRVFVARPGPLGMVLALVGLAAFAAIGIVLFLGLFLFLLPAVGVMIAAFLLAALLGGPRRL